MNTPEVRERLELLADLGYGFLESGQTTAQTERTLVECAHGLGLGEVTANFFGRLLTVETTTPDGATVTVTGAARSLDAVDCTRARTLNRLAAPLLSAPVVRVGRGSPVARPAPVSDETDLGGLRKRVSAARERQNPWWVSAFGLALLAFCISLQVGVAWQAWVTTAAVQLLSSAVGTATARLRMPRLFATAAQTTVGGAAATVLVQLGFVDPVGAAAALAVTWLLVLPLPQAIAAVTDAIEADYLSALTRIASVAVSAGGVFIGGTLTFALGELLGMDHPSLSELPSLPWYLGLVFAALGAIGNAFANGGGWSLVAPAATLGLVTSAAHQTLLAAGLPMLWAASISAAVLGVVAVFFAIRTDYPQQVLALMGITGALLPGLPVFFGILQQMGAGSGLAHFGHAGAICIGIGAGAALGSYLVSLGERSVFSVRDLRGNVPLERESR